VYGKCDTIKYRNFLLKGKACYEHHVAYQKYLTEMNEMNRDVSLDYFESLESALQAKEIDCFKLNNSLDDASLSPNISFQAKLRLSKDGSQLCIYVLKPTEYL
jgi:hypothetical protein